MKILAIAGVEDDKYIRYQIKQQTVQPDEVEIFVDKYPAEGIDNRRKKIAENHKLLRSIVKHSDADLIWQLEGDSQLPEKTLEILLMHYDRLKSKKFAYISGVQFGRHGVCAAGAWRFKADKSEFESVRWQSEEVEKVDATGFYCLLAPKKVWLEGEATWNNEPYGPDVNFGLSLKRKGYFIYVDNALVIGHKTPSGVIDKGNMSICNVRFYKTEKGWKYRTS